MMINYEAKVRLNKILRKSGNYYVVVLVSAVALIFLPLVGSTMDIGISIPKSFGGFMVWLTGRLAVAAVNLIIFHCFMQQGKVNVSENENYKAAIIKLNKFKKEKKILPLSPSAFIRKQWTGKGITLFLASMASSVFLAESVVNFDLTQFLTYLFTLTFGLGYGYLTMKSNEEYWTNDFIIYVDMLFDGEIIEEEKKELKSKEPDRHTIRACDYIEKKKAEEAILNETID